MTEFTSQGFGRELLSQEQLENDMAFIRRLAPENVATDHPAFWVAANGLALVRNRFGEPGAVRGYTGEIETVPVPAIYHNLQHTADGLQNLTAHMRKTNDEQAGAYSDADILMGLVAYANHDVVMGNGRQSENPGNHDELASANLLRRTFVSLGLGNTALANGARAGILATIFNEQTKSQDIVAERGFVRLQQDITAADLSGFATTRGPLNALNCAVESSCKASQQNWLTRLAESGGVTISSTLDALKVVDARATVDQKASLASDLKASAAFCKNYTFPNHWAIDDPCLRQQNGELMAYLAQSITGNEITAVEAYVRTEAYAS